MPILSLGTMLSIVPTELYRKNCPSKGNLELNHLLKQDVGELQACSAIIQGDNGWSGQGLFQEAPGLLKKKIIPAIRGHSNLNATNDVHPPSETEDSSNHSLSKEGKKISPLLTSMVVHEKIEMFERLLRAHLPPQQCVLCSRGPEVS